MADGWEVLEVLGSEAEAAVVCGYLESQGVPCQLDSAFSHEFPAPLTLLGEIHVQVPADRLDEARRLLAERENAPPAADDEEAG